MAALAQAGRLVFVAAAALGTLPGRGVSDCASDRASNRAQSMLQVKTDFNPWDATALAAPVVVPSFPTLAGVGGVGSTWDVNSMLQQVALPRYDESLVMRPQQTALGVVSQQMEVPMSEMREYRNEMEDVSTIGRQLQQALSAQETLLGHLSQEGNAVKIAHAESARSLEIARAEAAKAASAEERLALVQQAMQNMSESSAMNVAQAKSEAAQFIVHAEDEMKEARVEVAAANSSIAQLKDARIARAAAEERAKVLAAELQAAKAEVAQAVDTARAEDAVEMQRLLNEDRAAAQALINKEVRKAHADAAAATEQARRAMEAQRRVEDEAKAVQERMEQATLAFEAVQRPYAAPLPAGVSR